MTVQLSWTVEDVDGIRFVACRVRNDTAVPRRVRVDSCLDGPVLPPRRSGVAEAGWDRDGVTVRLGPHERRGLGFASPAPPVDPPVTLVETGAVVDDAGRDRAASTPTASDAVQRLGAHRPPRAAVAAGPDRPATVESRGADDTLAVAEADGSDSSSDPPVALAVELAGDASVAESIDSRGNDADSRGDDARGRPEISLERIEAWIDAVDQRVARAERLEEADLDAATDFVAGLGGLDAVGELDRRVAEDAATLHRVRERVDAVATRAESVDVPTAALERLS